jgi:hypothetical protein
MKRSAGRVGSRARREARTERWFSVRAEDLCRPTRSYARHWIGFLGFCLRPILALWFVLPHACDTGADEVWIGGEGRDYDAEMRPLLVFFEWEKLYDRALLGEETASEPGSLEDELLVLSGREEDVFFRMRRFAGRDCPDLRITDLGDICFPSDRDPTDCVYRCFSYRGWARSAR